MAVRRVLTWLAVVSMLLAVVALIRGGCIFYRYNVLLNDTRHQLEHSLEVKTAIDVLMLAMEDAETRQRGQVPSHQRPQRNPFHGASPATSTNS